MSTDLRVITASLEGLRLPTEGVAHRLAGFVVAERSGSVVGKAHRPRVERNDHHIAEEHLADAIEFLLQTRDRLGR